MIVENSSARLPFKGKSCDELYWNYHSNESYELPTPDAAHVAKATWIVLVAVSIVFLNVLMIVVLQCRRHSRFLPPQPRMLMTSLACTDLAVGALVCPFTVFPTLYDCWPYGIFHCGLEALLISALFHQSTLSLVLIAIDRYICIVHPLRYPAILTKKICSVMILMSWLFSFAVYSLAIYPSSSFHFDSNGLMSCEPYYARKVIIILAICFFYIPPVAVLFYCYITIFRIAKKQMKMVEPSTPPYTISGTMDKILRNGGHLVRIKKKMKLYRSSLTLAVIGFGFLLAVTPWTLSELISSCFEIKFPPWVEFTFTWIAISNSFWNPIIYGVLSNSFREIAVDIFRQFVQNKKCYVCKR